MEKRMKPFITSISMLCFLMAAGCAGKSALGTEDITKDTLKSEEKRVSYAIGLNIGKNIGADNVTLEYNAFLKGIIDGAEQKPALMTDEEVQTELTNFQQTLNEKKEKQKAADMQVNKEKGIKFLEENKKAKDVVTLPSGLQYSVIKQGTGPKPKATDTVKVHYAGTLIGGKEFDSSIKRGEPVEFPVNGVIPGWSEGIQLMNVGSKWKLFIPSDLAYGENGAGQDIGPNETLIFEVELLEIK
jgi:FKBP-type peptidyl-prolyl cis-trans isomerase FklB